jgi:hypothetical protein
MYPFNMLIDDLETAAGGIVRLRQMLLKHSSAEIRVIPRNPQPVQAQSRSRHVANHSARD